MSKYQLFKKIPPMEFIEEILKLYGLNGFDEHYYFSFENLINNNTIEHLNNKTEDFEKYYLKCKIKYYKDITLKKSITLLRQLLRPYNFKIISSEKYKNGKKYLLYNLSKNNITNNEETVKNLTIKFD